MSKIGNITPTRDILNSSDSARRTGDLALKTYASINAAQKGQRYDSRSELDKTGGAQGHDQNLAILKNATAYMSVGRIAYVKLSSQQQALTGVYNVMNEFGQELARSDSAVGSRSNKADKALGEIQRILRSKNPSGEYIFGGNDPFTDPLSVINQAGKRVSVDLIQQSNIKNGNIAENNYSTASADATSVTVSSAGKVRKNFLYAGMDPIVKAIGYLNMYKTGVVVATPTIPGVALEDISTAQTTYKQALELALSLIDSGIKGLQKAYDINSADIAKASTTKQEEQKGNLAELTSTAQNNIQSLMASASLANSADKCFEKLMQNIR